MRNLPQQAPILTLCSTSGNSEMGHEGWSVHLHPPDWSLSRVLSEASGPPVHDHPQPQRRLLAPWTYDVLSCPRALALTVPSARTLLLTLSHSCHITPQVSAHVSPPLRSPPSTSAPRLFSLWRGGPLLIPHLFVFFLMDRLSQQTRCCSRRKGVYSLRDKHSAWYKVRCSVIIESMNE